MQVRVVMGVQLVQPLRDPRGRFHSAPTATATLSATPREDLTHAPGSPRDLGWLQSSCASNAHVYMAGHPSWGHRGRDKA